MKYLLMVQGSQADYEARAGRGSPGGPVWDRAELRAMFDRMNAVDEELAANGELLDAQGLAAPSTTRLVTVDDDGNAVVTDDPYAAAEGVVAGYWLLECASSERVTEIAARVARCPAPAGSPAYPVVVRPVDEAGPDPGRARIGSPRRTRAGPPGRAVGAIGPQYRSSRGTHHAPASGRPALHLFQLFVKFSHRPRDLPLRTLRFPWDADHIARVRGDTCTRCPRGPTSGWPPSVRTPVRWSSG
ncbi:YciI family protein [Streptomyces sp. NPDC057235]|uniref:YciI family protein n=1 Tax=Streptomyces sp. NPDC057235 TaxID=3346058 RepID=UPI003644A74F